MTRFYVVLVWLYLLTALVWTFQWIPYGYGFYGFPWKSHGFKLVIQMWAWTHLVAGILLLGYGVSHRRRWWPVLVATALSFLAFVALYDWIDRYVRGVLNA